MIIDCHTHIGRNGHINASVSDLLKSMDSAGIDKALVYASSIADCPNDYLMEQIKPHRDRLYGVATVDLKKVPTNKRTIGWTNEPMSMSGMLRTLEAGAVGIKLYLGYEHFSADSPQVENVLSYAEDRKVPVIFHSGDCLHSCKQAKYKFCQPLDIDSIAVDFPNVKMVIAHLGNPWWRDAAQVCYKNDNVYSDVSGFVYGGFSSKNTFDFTIIISEFAAIASYDKLLFGTDFPISDQKSYVDNTWSFSQQKLSDNVKLVFNL